MVIDAIISILMLAAVVGVVLLGAFGWKALNEALPLLRTLVEQKQRDVASRDRGPDYGLENLESRVARLEQGQRELREATAFMQNLVESGTSAESGADEHSHESGKDALP